MLIDLLATHAIHSYFNTHELVIIFDANNVIYVIFNDNLVTQYPNEFAMNSNRCVRKNLSDERRWLMKTFAYPRKRILDEHIIDNCYHRVNCL